MRVPYSMWKNFGGFEILKGLFSKSRCRIVNLAVRHFGDSHEKDSTSHFFKPYNDNIYLGCTRCTCVTDVHFGKRTV